MYPPPIVQLLLDAPAHTHTQTLAPCSVLQ